MELERAIEAILFYQAEPMTISRISKLLKRTEGEVRDALLQLREKLSDTGLALVQNGDEVMLGTSPEASVLLADITKEELSKDLSKSSLETLAVVLYRGPITRAEIDYVRGVNSNFILRNLQIRGLVEKIDNPNDQRSFLYKPTFQLLEYMGVTRIEELPEYATTMETLATFIASKEEEEKQSSEGEKINTEETRVEQELDGIDDNESTATAMSEVEQEFEADIMDENEAGEAYDDKELQERRKADEPLDRLI